jgi:hypothetical protein
MHGAIGARSRYPTYARRVSRTVFPVTFRRAGTVTFPGPAVPGTKKAARRPPFSLRRTVNQSARATAGGAVLPMTETSAAATAELGEAPDAAVMRRRRAP